MADSTISEPAHEHTDGITITWKWLLDVAIAAAALVAGWLLISLLISRRALLEPAEEEVKPEPAREKDGES